MNGISVIQKWLPFLLEGLGYNILISVAATCLGILIGLIFVWLTFSRFGLIRRLAYMIPSILRGAPTLFLLFYLAILIPSDVSLFGGAVKFFLPIWAKATVALAASPFTFAIWNLRASIDFWRTGERQSALLFIPNTLNAFLITFLASSGSSLIGVSELVGRTNTVIKASGSENAIMLYGFAVLLFIVSAAVLTLLVEVLMSRFSEKIPAHLTGPT